MEYKLCIYAICKNESKFIDRWVTSLREADHMVVLDTGSTDDTVEKLKKYEPWLEVHQEIIEPWRFDTARNRAMELIPEEYNICVTSDCDQIWEPGFAAAIKERFAQGFEEVSGPITDYDENGEPVKTFLHRNVHLHSSLWKWVRPVHEHLQYLGEGSPKSVIDDRFIIKHYPDKSKSREQYSDLLKQEYENNRTDPYCAIYWGCDLGDHGKTDEAIEVFERGLVECDFSKTPEIAYQMHLNLAIDYANYVKDYAAALDHALAARQYGLQTRRMYVISAQTRMQMGDYEGAEKDLLDARELVPTDCKGWIEDRDLFESRFDDILADVRRHLNKVVVYAICKNEEDKVERWYNCVKDADAVVVVDTGSTDETIEAFKRLNASNLNLTSLTAAGDFRFDVARNTALDAARKLNLGPRAVYIALDLDEFMREGDIDKLRSTWSPHYDIAYISLLNYADSPIPMKIDYRVHSADPHWHWHRLVHEIITREDKKPKEWVSYDPDILFYHEPDMEKPRDYYDLLKKEYEEESAAGILSAKTCTYLAWEAVQKPGEEENCARYAEKALDILYHNINDEFYEDYQYILQNLVYIIQCRHDAPNFSVAEAADTVDRILRLKEFPDNRQTRYNLGSYYWSIGDYESALYQYLFAMGINEPYHGWIDNPSLYINNAGVYSNIALCFYKLDMITEAYYFAQKAYKISDEEYIVNNYNFYKELYENKYIKPEIKENKICVYAMCKNESQFVDKWYESMKEADEIVVLDTGSNDDTVEKLRAHGVKVEVHTFKYWRFDLARDWSMKLIPDDCNILVCTDLDEILEPGWAKILKDQWIETKHKRAYYKYSWSHLPNGEDGRVFCYDKFHCRGWTWIFPVHEMLYFPYNEDTGDVHRENEEALQLFNEIHLHHYPDFSKPRTSYLPLLEQRARENPEDWYGLIYLAHEYFYRKMYQNSIDLLHKILEKYKEHYSTLEQASCYLFAGDSYAALEQYDEAVVHFQEAIKIEPTYREPYINLAKVYRELKQFDKAKETLLIAIKSTYRHYTWLERDISWTYELADEMCLATWNLGDSKMAAQWAAKAWSYEPENERLCNNLKICINNLSELDLV